MLYESIFLSMIEQIQTWMHPHLSQTGQNQPLDILNHKNIDQNDIPITPYYQFMVEMLDEIKKKETMMNYEQKCEAISTLWNEMSEKEKKSYHNNKTAITENILKRSKNCAINGIDFDDLDLFREFDEI